MYDTLCSRSKSTPVPTARKRSLITAGLGIAMVLNIAAPAFALDPGHDIYDGGTATTVPQGAEGSLDTASPTTLIFKASNPSAKGEIDIPYQAIQSMQYSTELARHLGAVPAAAAGLVRHRERKHYLTINYQDASGAAQTALFEIPKQEPRVLLPILRIRTPICQTKPNSCSLYMSDRE